MSGVQTLDGTNSDLTSVLVAHEYYLKHQGSLPEDSPYRYETALEMRHRFLRTLEKYKIIKTIIIVTHGMLMPSVLCQMRRLIFAK